MLGRYRLVAIGIVFLISGLAAPSLVSQEKSNHPYHGVEHAVQEADSLYGRLVAILNNVDIPERYEAVEEILEELWDRIVTLETRYPELDSDRLSDALFEDEEFVLLGKEFDRQLERIHTEMPAEGERLAMIIEREVHQSFTREMDAKVERAVRTFGELIQALEGIETAEDAESSFDEIRELALALRGIEGDDEHQREKFWDHMGRREEALDLSERFNSVLGAFEEDPRMKIVFDALDPLIEQSGSDGVADSSPSEQEALAQYRLLLEQSIALFTKLQTPDDVDLYAHEIRSLGKKEAEISSILPGSQGERLIESDPELVRLLEKLGAEQMRIFENQEMSTRITKIFSGE